MGIGLNRKLITQDLRLFSPQNYNGKSGRMSRFDAGRLSVQATPSEAPGFRPPTRRRHLALVRLKLITGAAAVIGGFLLAAVPEGSRSRRPAPQSSVWHPGAEHRCAGRDPRHRESVAN